MIHKGINFISKIGKLVIDKNSSLTFTVLILIVLSFSSGVLWKNDCEQFCENPNRDEIYKNFSIEKQFEHYRTCPCWGDSISNTGIYLETLYKHENIVEFLVLTLKTENDPDVLIDALELLSSIGDRKYNIYAKDLRGKKDIADLVHKTIAKIPEKDERDFFEKLRGEKIKSRKERLQKIAKKIEEQTAHKYEVIINIKEEKGN